MELGICEEFFIAYMLYIRCPMHFRCRVIYPTIILSDLIELTKLIMTIVFILPVKILTNARLAATSGIPLCDVRFIYIEINYVSVLIERPRDFLTCFRDCLEFLPKSLKQLAYPLLGVGPGGPRRLPSGPWSDLRLIKDHAVEADVSGPPRTEFLAFQRAFFEDVHRVHASDGFRIGGRIYPPLGGD
jgi:hypothetical protein